MFIRQHMIMEEDAGFMGSSGGSAPAPDAVPGDLPVTVPTDPPAVTYEYPEGLDGDLQGNQTLLKYADKETGKFNHAHVMKALVHATGQLGKDKMVIPNKDSSPEDWSKTFEMLGLPGRTDYIVENNLPEGATSDDAFYSGLLDAGHSAGVLPKQMQQISDYLNKTIGENIVQDQTDAKLAVETGQKELREEFGEGYERKLGLANSALKHFADLEEVKAMVGSGLLNNPKVAKIFIKIGEALRSEDSFDSNHAKTFEMTPDEAQKQIKTFYEKDHPFRNRRHQGHKAAQEQMLKLQVMAKAGRAPEQQSIVINPLSA